MVGKQPWPPVTLPKPLPPWVIPPGSWEPVMEELMHSLTVIPRNRVPLLDQNLLRQPRRQPSWPPKWYQLPAFAPHPITPLIIPITVYVTTYCLHTKITHTHTHTLGRIYIYYSLVPSVAYSRSSIKPSWMVEYRDGRRAYCVIGHWQGFFCCLFLSWSV